MPSNLPTTSPKSSAWACLGAGRIAWTSPSTPPRTPLSRLKGGFGDVSLTGLTQRVTVDTGFGLITAQDLQTGENPIHLVTSFGDIQFENSTAANSTWNCPTANSPAPT